MTPVSRDEYEALRAEVSGLRRRVEVVEALSPVVSNHGGRLEMLESELAGLKQELGAVHAVVDRLLSASTTQGLTMERVEKLLVQVVATLRGPA